jgi:glycerol-3-phosphate dehydrogenase
VIKNYFEDKKLKTCFTDKILLTGSFRNEQERKKYGNEIRNRLNGLSDHTLKYLIENYGKQTDTILTAAEKISDPQDVALLKAEIEFCVSFEMVSTLADFFVRRTGLLYFNIRRLRAHLKMAAQYMQDRLEWSDERTKEEIRIIENLVKSATEFN